MRLPAIAAAACVAIALDAGEQRATFSSRAEAVRIDVSVTNRGRPVAGLTAADFEVFDNGIPQKIEVLDTEEVPVDLMMALDTSSSVTGERLAHLRSASQTALGFLTTRDRAGLLTFGHEVVLRAPLSFDLAEVRDALVQPLTSGYRTSLVDGVYAALAHADGGVGRALVIVFSDGVDTGSWLTAADVSETARRLDAVMFGVSTGAPKRSVLDDLADASGGELIRIQSTRELTATLQTLLQNFRQRYVLSFVPDGVEPGGWHALSVRTKRRGLTVKARAGYFGS